MIGEDKLTVKEMFLARREVMRRVFTKTERGVLILNSIFKSLNSGEQLSYVYASEVSLAFERKIRAGISAGIGAFLLSLIETEQKKWQ